MVTLIFAVLAAIAALGAVFVYRPRTAPSPQAFRELVVRHVAFPLPMARPGEPDYDPLYAIPSRKILGEASGRRHPYRPTSIVTLGRPTADGRELLPSPARLVAAAAIARCPLTIEPTGIDFSALGNLDLVLRVGGGPASLFESDSRFSLARLIEVTDAYPQAHAIEITLGGPVTRHLPIHDADSLLDFCESIAGASGLPVGLRAEADDVPFWMELVRLIDTTHRSVDFVTIPGGDDILSFAIGFSRVQKLFAMRSLHGRTAFTGARQQWTTEEALLAFALGCDALEIETPRAFRTSALAGAIVEMRRRILAASRDCGALHPADVLAAQIELIDPPCWARTAAEMFGGRGVGSACGDERRFIDVVERTGNALPFRRRH
jgi:hypothetical protein